MSASSEPYPIKTVTVYAASSAVIDDSFIEVARHLGKRIAAEGWRQVNGGGLTGLMGAVTQGGVAAGGIVDAVILDIFADLNMSPLLHNVEVVDNMPARKALLYQAADAIIALPGGLGTLEELMEVACWQQLGLHHKPIVLVNVNGFWTGFFRWLEDITRQGFVAGDFEQRGLYICDTAEAAIEAIKGYRVVQRDLTTLYRGIKTPNVKAAELAEVTSDWDAARRKFEGQHGAQPMWKGPWGLAMALATGVMLGLLLGRSRG
eukprot:GGOE01036461.1.p1 GENE.GGOE01036461.1~~GGOE01036461.1.p1  ORF type:complete len:283 (+),score=89.12 GGOE01036461.1:66-851(+)